MSTASVEPVIGDRVGRSADVRFTGRPYHVMWGDGIATPTASSVSPLLPRTRQTPSEIFDNMILHDRRKLNGLSVGTGNGFECGSIDRSTQGRGR